MGIMKSFRSPLTVLATVFALAGCSAQTTSGHAEASENVTREAASASREGHGRRGHGFHAKRAPMAGPEFLTRVALKAPIDLTPEQRAKIEGLVANAPHAKFEGDPARSAKLAAAIRSNTVESLEAPQADEAKRKERLAAVANTMTTLHDTLTAEQRSKLVASLEQKAERFAERHGKKGRAHGDQDNAGGEGREGRRFRGAMPMVADLNLTPEQQEAIRQKLAAGRPEKPTAEQIEAWKAKRESMRAAFKAKLENFKSDKFDAASFVAPPERDGRIDGKARTRALAAVVSVLTPEQREALAKKIESGRPMPNKAWAKPETK